MSVGPDPEVAFLRSYLVEQVGLGGTEVFPNSHLALALGSALADHELIISPQTDTTSLHQLQEKVMREQGPGWLPPDLRSFAAYKTRCRELVASGSRTDFFTAELATAVAEHRADPSVPAEVRQRFERVAAHAYVKTLLQQPDTLFIASATPIKAVSDANGRRLVSESGKEIALPRNNQSLVEYGPGISRGLTGVVERARRVWTRVIMVHNDEFTAEVSRTYAEARGEVKRITVHSDGMGAASVDLAAQQRDGAFGTGFDAVLMSGLSQADTAQMAAAVHSAPELLGPGGVLFIRDPEESSIENIVTPASVTVGFAREAFGHGPAFEHTYRISMTGDPMTEAAFVKPRE